MSRPGQNMFTLLMLAPLITLSASTGVALFSGLTTALVLLVSTALFYVVQRLVLAASQETVPAGTRLPLVMLVLSVVTSLTVLLAQRWFYEAALLTGIWLPLISANLVVVRQLLTVDYSRPVLQTITETLKLAMLIITALTALALCRELAGNGRVLSNMHLFMDSIPAQGIDVIPGWPRLKLFEMVPGALLLLSLFLAIKRLAAKRMWSSRHPQLPAVSGQPDSSLRVRVTGKIS
jgi:Na+-translocating ferredoxin:NAD+ oxidoreductase RnfE subunit